MVGEEPFLVLENPGEPWGAALRRFLSGIGYLPRRHGEPRLWVLSPGLVRLPRAVPAPGAHLILKAGPGAAAAFAAETRLPFLDYGFSQSASLTFSSRTETTAVLALQRPVRTLSGGLIEPMELPLTLSGPLPDDLLLAAAAILLLGERTEALRMEALPETPSHIAGPGDHNISADAEEAGLIRPEKKRRKYYGEQESEEFPQPDEAGSCQHRRRIPQAGL